MIVEIDEHSGFCFGVVNAIRKAEEELEKGVLYCVGDIVHNGLRDCRVLFRPHGEPPLSYELAIRNGVEIIDASCPVVLNLQKKIRAAYEKTKEKGAQIVIYGKQGHAEVVGLVGQTNGTAVVVEREEDLQQIDFSCPVILFSQTTKSLAGFKKVAALLQEKGRVGVTVYDTICRKVANRIPQLRKFAALHDVILFVSGEKSSNGKQLFSVCKEVNPRTYFVQGVADVKPEMWEHSASIGISGATSTPRWIMEEMKSMIEQQ